MILKSEMNGHLIEHCVEVKPFKPFGVMKMKQVTVAILASQLGIEYATASALIKLMQKKGVCKEVGKTDTKGKPSKIYEIPEKFEISLAN